jgi:hypothetical protein
VEGSAKTARCSTIVPAATNGATIFKIFSIHVTPERSHVCSDIHVDSIKFTT